MIVLGAKKRQVFNNILATLIVFSLLSGLMPPNLFRSISVATASELHNNPSAKIDTDTASNTNSENALNNLPADETTSTPPTESLKETPNTKNIFDKFDNDPLSFLQKKPLTVLSPSHKNYKAPRELLDERTEKTRTLDLGNGFRKLQIFDQPAHFKENGVWKGIDTKLKPSLDGGYENSANSFRALFGSKGKSEDLLYFEYEGKSVSYKLAEVDARDVAPVVSGPKITYENILHGVDIRQLSTRNGIKEDIVLKKYNGKNSFRFELKQKGVQARKESDGSIAFFDKKTKEQIFSIPRPFMFDTRTDSKPGYGTISDKVEISVDQHGSRTYLTITADDSWLRAPERNYPVFIDPTLIAQSEVSDVSDAYVASSYGSINFNNFLFNNSVVMPVGYYDEDMGRQVSFFKFQIPQELRGTIIEGATFNANCSYSEDSYNETLVALGFPTSSWNSGTITWNSMPDISYSTRANVYEGEVATFDISNKFEAWLYGSEPNYGLALYDDEFDPNNYKSFVASENNTDAPYLEVIYSLDDTWPEVYIDSPAHGSITDESPILQYSVYDSESEITDTTIKIDGEEIDADTYDEIGPLDDGQHELYIRAEDEWGNYAWRTATFTVDTTPPDITISSPTESLTTDNYLLLEYAINDITRITTKIIELDGQRIYDKSGTFIGPLSNGSHDLQIYVEDEAGNYQEENVAFTVDTIPPKPPVVVSVQARPDGNMIVWKRAADENDIVGYKIYHNGYCINDEGDLNGALITGESYLDTWIFSDRVEEYQIQAVDSAGLSSELSAVATAMLVTDNSPPAPPKNFAATIEPCGYVKLNWAAALDNMGTAARYYISRTPSDFGNATTNEFLIDDSVMPSTKYTYNIFAKDAQSYDTAGLSSTSIITPSTIHYEETNTAVHFYTFGYGGQWNTFNNLNHSSDTIKASNTTDHSCSMSFNGNGVKWIGSKSSNFGIARVFIDGIYQKDVDCYSLNDSYQKVLYSNMYLPKGNHTLSIHVSGMKNNDASDYFVPIDSFEILSDLDEEPPSKPTELNATQVSPTQVSLTWNPATDNIGVEGYEIARSIDGINFTPITKIITDIHTGSATTSYIDSAITAGAKYYYRVRAYDNPGNYSGYSSPTNLTTFAEYKRFEDTASEIIYTGSWARKNYYALTGNTYMESKEEPLSTASLSFIGNKIAWIGHISWAPAKVYIDDVYVTDVAPEVSDEWGAVFTQSWSAPGNHTIRIENTTGGRISVDAFDVGILTDTQAPSTPGNLTAVATGKTQVNIAWNAATDNYGISRYELERSIDQANWTQITTTSTNTYTDTAVTPGAKYYYRVRACDAAGNNSGYSSMAEATTYATTRYEENNTAILKTGTWYLQRNNTSYSDGYVLNASTSGRTITFTFIGSEVTWVSVKAQDRGVAKVYIDNVYQQNVDLYALTPAYNQFVYTKTGLPYGTHTIKVEVNGTKNASATGTRVDVDAFDVTQIPSRIDRHEETSGSVSKTGTWGSYFAGPYSYGYELISSTTSSTLTFSFTGTAVSWISTRGTDRGIAKVYIDNVYQQNIDLYASSGYSNYPVYTKSDLPYALHTIKIEVTGTKNASSTGKKIDVDAFDVASPTDVSAPAPSVKRAEESHPAVVMSGAWSSAIGAALSSCYSLYSSNTASTATYSFTGTAVSWISTKGSDRGIGKVYIDNVYQQDVDLYASAYAYRQAVYSKTGLTYGAHTIKITPAAAKNASSTGTRIDADAFDVTANDDQVPSDPTNLVATPAGTTQVNLAWSASTDNVGVAGYKVERSIDQANWTQIASTSTNLCSDTSVLPGTKYYYRVNAYDANGSTSAYSSVATATTNASAVSSVEYVSDNVPTIMALGSEYPISLTVRNTGSKLWNSTSPNPVRLMYHWFDENNQLVKWDDGQRGVLDGDLSTGNQKTIPITIKTPATQGTYVLKLDMVEENVSTFSEEGVSTKDIVVDVGPKTYSVEYRGHNTPPTMSLLTSYPVSVTLKNTGSKTWNAGMPNAVNLVYHWYDSNGQLVVEDDGNRGLLDANIPTGDEDQIAITVASPPSPGLYTLKYELAEDSVGSFTALGVETMDVEVNVVDGIVPTMPTSLAATPASPKQINLSWTAATDNVAVAGYTIERSTNGRTFTQIGTPATNSYSDSNLTPNTKFYYRVNAYDAAGNKSTITSPVSAITYATTRFEQTNANVAYSGSWSTYSIAGASGGSMIYSATTGNYSTLTFSGPSVSFVTAKANNLGIAKIYIDGALDANVDLYSSAPAASPSCQETVYAKSGLSNASHTIRIEVSGTKNPSSSSNRIYIDAFDISGTPDSQDPSAPSSLAANATSTSKISLNWNASTDNIGIAGYTIERSEDGTNFSELSSTTSTSYADNGLASSKTYYYRVSAYDLAGNVSAFSNTANTSTLKVERYEETSSRLSKTGTWIGVNASYGQSPYNYSAYNAVFSNSSASTATFSFTGTSVTWIGTIGPGSGIANVYIDGMLQQSVDTFYDGYDNGAGPADQYGQPIYTKSGLSLAPHTIKIEVTGTKNPSSYACNIDIDAFDIETTPDTQTPSKPTSISAVATGTTAISLSWTAATDNVGISGYIIKRSTDGTYFYTVGYSPSASYADSGLSANSSYAYKIIAYDHASNNSAISDVANATTYAWAHYEETNPAVVSVGTWNPYSCVDLSGGSYRWSSTANDYTTLTFEGASVSWVTVKGPSYGIAKVYIDNVYQQDVDLYNTQLKWKEAVYTKSGLTFGTHTIKIVVSGTKNSASANYYVGIDAFNVATAPDAQTPTTPTNLTATAGTNQVNLTWNESTDDIGVSAYKLERSTNGSTYTQIATTFINSYTDTAVSSGSTYYYRVRACDIAANNSGYSNVAETTTHITTRIEETDASVVFAGTWGISTTSSNSGASAKYSNDYTTPASATITFTGTGISWIGAKTTNRGIAKVYLDGIYQQEVDMYSATTQFQQVFYSKMALSNSQHTLKIEATDRMNAEAIDRYTSVDAFDVATEPDTQAPTTPANLMTTAGTNQVNLTWNESTDNIGVSAYKLERSTNGSTYTQVATASTNSYTDTAVSSGSTYYYRVRASDIAANNSGYSNVTMTTTYISTRIEETNPAVVSIGTWNPWSHTNLSGGSYKWSSTANDYTTVTFTGTAVSWITVKYSSYGIAKVYIDNVYQQDVDLYDPELKYQQAVYTKSGLTLGTHTIKIVVSGTKNPASTNYYVGIDAFDLGIIDSTPPTITATPLGSAYNKAQSVTLTQSEPASIFYTLDGTNPTTSSAQYVGLPLTIAATATIKAIAIDGYGNQSPIYMQTYNIETIPPTASFVWPNDGNTISGNINVATSETDELELKSANLKIEKFNTNHSVDMGTLQVSGTNANLSWPIDTSKFSDGEYRLVLSVVDLAGNQVLRQRNVKIANNTERLGQGHWGMVDNGYGDVNIANGNFIIDEEDIDLPCYGPGTNITRIYNSRSKTNGPLGWGWSIDVPELAEYSDGSVVITEGDGTRLQYSRNLNGTYTPPTGRYESLTIDHDNYNAFVWKFKNGDKYIFDRQNVTLIDRNGNSVVYEYNGSGQLVSITDPAERVTNLVYNTNGKIISVTDYTGRVWNYTYDAFDNLETVTKPNIGTIANPVRYTKKYTYHSNHQISSIIDEEGFVSDPVYATATFNYANEQLVSINECPSSTKTYTTAFEYPTNNQFRLVDARGNSTIYDFNATTWQIEKITDAKGYSTSFAHYPDYNVKSRTDSRGNITTYTYTANGNLATEKEPDLLTSSGTIPGYITSYTYDQNNNVLTKTNGRGYPTKYEYDSESNLVREIDALDNVTKYTYDDYGNKLSMTDSLQHTTRYTYDGYGNLATEIDPQDNATRYSYDKRGNKIGYIDAENSVTNYSFDALDRLTEAVDPLFNVTRTDYNRTGDKKAETDPSGVTTSYFYDRLGRLITISDALQHSTYYLYDELDNIVSETDPENKKITNTYNSVNQLEKVEVQKQDSSPVSTSYTYDGNGNKLSTKDAKNNITTWEFDELNRVIKTVNPGNRVHETTFDENGNIVMSKTPDGKITTNTYDKLDRLTEIHYSLNNKTVTYKYDSEDNRIEMNDSNGATTYKYNKCDLLTEEHRPTYTIEYTYWATHNLKNRKLSGNSIQYNYDIADKLLNIQDGDTILSPKLATYTYKPNGYCNSITYLNNSLSEFTYDDANKISRVESKVNSSSSPFRKFEYSYYKNDLIQTTTDTAGSISTSLNYQYDDENRLIKVVSPTKSVDYKYDSVGNRMKATETAGTSITDYTYTYDQTTSQLMSVDKQGSRLLTYDYDSNDNLIERCRAGETTTTYEYTPEHQLSKVGNSISYVYDGDNQRISKTVNGVTTNYTYEGDLIASESIDGIVSTYVYDNDGSPVCVIKGTSKYYFHYDGQGSVIALTDSTGNVVTTYEYDPWGNITKKTGTIDTPFTYRGEYSYVYDNETNFYFLKSRYYDPEIGRFTTKDRFEGFDERPSSQNPYTYCENDPVNTEDPEGEAPPLLMGAAVITYRAYSLYDTYQDLKNWKKLSHEDKAWAVAGIVGGKGVKLGKRVTKFVKAANKAKKAKNKPVQNGIALSSKLKWDNGRIAGYTTYGKNGVIRKQVRLTGKTHSKALPRPNVKYPNYNNGYFNGYKVRKAKNWELPRSMRK